MPHRADSDLWSNLLRGAPICADCASASEAQPTACERGGACGCSQTERVAWRCACGRVHRCVFARILCCRETRLFASWPQGVWLCPGVEVDDGTAVDTAKPQIFATSVRWVGCEWQVAGVFSDGAS
mmetsp:Transcript_74740/g.224696  ORF Transcript_74740/g.224696 Transcript_74740/m.224696 type:complete len:126 (-) Transcript_74740:11-388(-)